MIASATADLEGHQTAMGSAVINIARQIGSVLGTSVLVLDLVLPEHVGSIVKNCVFVNVWWMAGAISVIGAIAAFGISTKRLRGTAP
ncbi:hypothetical protein SAMN04487897_10367 [Paenibacillus sp. yr247]|nr:hypothetical protein SAMN04487897_10367 [Paenibacillus sp. yr247]